MTLKRLKDEHPAPHARYIVIRNGFVFTATPCYGMHKPWWVVLTMGCDCSDEAEPVSMDENDLWCSLPEVGYLVAKFQPANEPSES